MKDTFLAQWLAGELDNEELNAFREEDPERYARLMRIKQQFETIEKPEFDTEAVLNTIVSKQKNKVIQLKPSRKYWLQSVAAAAVIIILGLTFVLTRPEKMEAVNGATLAFALPDKSAVQLNCGSVATYSNNNWDESREISLDGEAYFKVAKGQVFTVKTPIGNVVVTGTQFNVKARGTRLDVTCYEGSVKVEAGKNRIVLTAGKAVFITNGIAGDVVTVLDKQPAWLQGELVFYHESLEAITREIERKFDIKIQNQYTTDKTFTGALPGNNAGETLNMLGLIYPIKTETHNKTIILTPIDAKR
jgi:transmembrane sensor